MALFRHFQQKTRQALLWMNLANEPFVVLYALLPFIFRKDLQASLLQISILTALRPVLPLFSFYWSANLTRRKELLRPNLILAWILGRLPFLLVPWIHNAWYLIFCCVCYEFFNKSGIPALIEILKINLPKEAREKTYTTYFVLSFCESILLGLLTLSLLHYHPTLWPLLCGITALISLSSLWAQLQIPLPQDLLSPTPLSQKNLENIWIKIAQPWKDAYLLLKENRDFARFQWSFMIGGFGLMLIAPSLAIFYVDYLQLDHAEIVTGRSILMGVGIVLSSQIWRKWLSDLPIPQLTLRILIGFGLFPLSLLLSQTHMAWFYIAFIIYGVAQAGSHLLWNLSGTLYCTQPETWNSEFSRSSKSKFQAGCSIFAKNEDSAQYSRVNILMAGLRGIVAPTLGGALCACWGPLPMLIAGTLICLAGAVFITRNEARAGSPSLP